MIDLKAAIAAVDASDPIQSCGRVCRVVGLVIEVEGAVGSIGELCEIELTNEAALVPAEIVGFLENRLLLMPYEFISGIRPGNLVYPRGAALKIKVGEDLIGRVIDGLGRPIDGKPNPKRGIMRSLECRAPSALSRKRIDTPLITGIRAIDGLLTCGEGQRLGFFAGSGVGKSVLLGMLACRADADVIVLALIGERGREVREFIESELGPEGLKRSIVIAVTNDASALEKIKGAETAMTIAEHFRDKGKRVLLMMDSLTRYAMALREVGLASGEPPTSKGYTPSVFAKLPRLLERAGKTEKGMITGLFTVLVEGDDMNDPVADTVRSILDGHIVLSRKLAASGHYPAIDVLESVSRLFTEVASPEQVALGRKLLASMSLYRENEDLIQIGAYQQGSSEEIDRAIELRPRWQEFLQQERRTGCGFEETQQKLATVLGA